MISSVSRCRSVLKDLEQKSKDFAKSGCDIKEARVSFSRSAMLRAFGRFYGLRGCDLEVYCLIGGFCLSRAIRSFNNSPYNDNDIEALNYAFAECSLRYIAFKCGCSVASVKRSLNNLEALSFLCRCGRGSHHRNKYKLRRCFRFNGEGCALFNYVANNEPLNNLIKEKEIHKEINKISLIYASLNGFMSFCCADNEAITDNLEADNEAYIKECCRIAKINVYDLLD